MYMCASLRLLFQSGVKQRLQNYKEWGQNTISTHITKILRPALFQEDNNSERLSKV